VKKLTPEEEAVIERKHTEAPFSGEYNDFYQEGTYVCRRCGQKLFDSAAKFRSGCGWPSFDEHFPGSVKRVHCLMSNATPNIGLIYVWALLSAHEATNSLGVCKLSDR